MLVIIISGYNGSKAKELAVKIFEKFIQWYELYKRDEYFPKEGLENMIPKKCCKELLRIAKNIPSETPTHEAEKLMFEEIKKYPRKSVFINDDEEFSIIIKGFIFGSFLALIFSYVFLTEKLSFPNNFVERI